MEGEGEAVPRQLTGSFREVFDLNSSPSSYTIGGSSKRVKLIEFIEYPVTMVTEIWKDFPLDLLELVLARLPVATFFRLRSVSLGWDNLVTSQSFSRLCTEVPKLPWFCTISSQSSHSVVMFDPSRHKWHLTSLPFLDSREIRVPVTSAGGLVCFTDTWRKHLFVCNPLTRSSKVLPRRPGELAPGVVGMTLDGDSASKDYRIIWLESSGDHRIYNSVEDCWTGPYHMPSHIKLPLYLNLKSQHIAIGSTLYFMHTAPDGIVSYDMVSGDWKQYIVPYPSHIIDHSLAECGGRIMLVGLLARYSRACVCIWELQKMTLLWKEVDRMPNMLCPKFHRRHVRLLCQGNQDFIMFSLMSLNGSHFVTYNLSTKDWEKASGFVFPRGMGEGWFAYARSFFPVPITLDDI